VLNSFGQRKLVVYDWQHSERKEFPLRTPYGSMSALSMCWSPDGKRLAAKVDSASSFYSVIIYDTDSWKPIADWPSGFVGSSSVLAFSKNGRLFQLMGGEINSLDVTALKGL
jgi:WD40 repeat protein